MTRPGCSQCHATHHRPVASFQPTSVRLARSRRDLKRVFREEADDPPRGRTRSDRGGSVLPARRVACLCRSVHHGIEASWWSGQARPQHRLDRRTGAVPGQRP